MNESLSPPPLTLPPPPPQIAKLRRVLVAYSWYDTGVGYCQGLNRLAAIALLFLDEEYAFWCLVTIVQHLLPPDYYNATLLGSQTDQVTFDLASCTTVPLVWSVH